MITKERRQELLNPEWRKAMRHMCADPSPVTPVVLDGASYGLALLDALDTAERERDAALEECERLREHNHSLMERAHAAEGRLLRRAEDSDYGGAP